MGWECFCVVGFDRGPLLQGRARILHLQYFFKYVLTYSLHLNSYLVTFLHIHNTICRAQLFCPFLLSGSEFLLNMLFNYHLCGRGSIPVMAVSGKAGSCLPLVGSLQYTTLANSMYWFPLPFQLPVVI